MAARSITKRFPGVVANDAVEFEAEVGEVHALLGENGAGKSTLSNMLTGLYRPDSGHIEVGGEPVQLGSPRAAIAAGIGMVHQHFRLVAPFTVAENIVLGHDPAFLLQRGEIEQRVRALSQQFGLDVDPTARIWQLSVGEQQRVEIIKALYRDARILILDEPTAVLTPQEADKLFETVRALARSGRTVIFISHKLHEVMAVADRVTVLRAGRSVATVRTADVTQRVLASLMVGREVAGPERIARQGPVGEPVLQLADVSAIGDRGVTALSGVSLTVCAGEILGIAGVAGNGQRELAEAITGLRRCTGTIALAGRPLASGSPRAAIEAGIAHVPEDRLGTAVAPSLSIAENLELKRYRLGGMLLRRRAMATAADQLIERYEVKAPGPHAPARQLSGGNLQKVVLGREFAAQPRVLIAASPTRGLDVGAIETVHAHLRDAASRGVAVLLISEDLDEILALADRVAVLFEGRIAGELEGSIATPEALGLLMAGGSAAA